MDGRGKFSDDELADLLKGKDKAAFNHIFEKYYNPLCFFANRIVQDNFSAEDIVQDIFVKLWQKSDVLTGADAIRAYLYVSVRNACLNYLEKNTVKLKHNRSLDLNDQIDHDTILKTLIQAEVARQVFDAVDTLPEQCRKIIRMTFEEGKKPREIAEEMCINISTVNSQKMRGLGLLRNRLADEGLALSLLLFLPEIITHYHQ